MLLESIQAASLEARKSKLTERASLLVTLYAEAARVGKDAGNRVSTDDEVLKVVRKFVKGVDESLAVLPEGEARDKALREKAVLEEFVPRLTTGEALAAVVADIVAQLPERSAKQMGAVMGALKTKLGGAYDGKEASALVKAALA